MQLVYIQCNILSIICLAKVDWEYIYLFAQCTPCVPCTLVYKEIYFLVYTYALLMHIVLLIEAKNCKKISQFISIQS